MMQKWTDDDDSDEDDEGLSSDTIDENLEKLIEKYANLARDNNNNDNEVKRINVDNEEDYNDSETDYYSMRIESRPRGVLNIASLEGADSGQANEELNKKHEKTNQERKEKMSRTAAVAVSLETSLIETGRELNMNDSAVSSASRLSKADLSKIYVELNDIHQRLLNEYNIFKKKEKLLRQRELKIKQNEDYLSVVANPIQVGPKHKLDLLKAQYDEQLEHIRDDIKAKVKENKRLYHAFKSIRDSNESLRLKLNESQERLAKMERQNSALNGRLFSLLKRMEMENRPSLHTEHRSLEAINDQQTQPKTPKIRLEKVAQLKEITTLDAFIHTLEWINETSLKPRSHADLNLPMEHGPTSTGELKLLEKVQRILPVLSQLLHLLNSNSSSNAVNERQYAQVVLEFAYWSALHVDANFHNQKINLSATFRHIAQEVFKCLEFYRSSTNYSNRKNGLRFDELQTDVAQHNSVKSTPTVSILVSLYENKHVRILSCLIILKMLNQVDILIHVFEQMKDDLVDDESKQTFLNYYGTWAVLKYCRLTNHILLDQAVDVYLQMCVESSSSGDEQGNSTKVSSKFIETCSNEYWFSQIALIFRNSTILSSTLTATTTNPTATTATTSSSTVIHLKVIEKLSILLQKLSKLKSNRKYFEMFSLNKICSNLLQRFYNESEFMTMNLKSIILNLNADQKSKQVI